MRFSSYSSQNGKVKQITQQPMLDVLWDEENPHLLLVGWQTGGVTTEISVENSQKAKNKSTI